MLGLKLKHVSKRGHNEQMSLSPVRPPAITWSNAGMLSIGSMATNYKEIAVIFIQEN